ncbi:MAG: CBS domain-containing protein [Chloroflexota bacterium]|nr:CBS domain-containing protein [Chloroflexota bacterium]
MNESTNLRVEDVMSTNIRSIEGLATVLEAIDMMRQYGINSLAVMRRDGDDEAGLLLLRDIAVKVVAQNRSSERVNVYEVMTKPAFTLPPKMMVRNAVRLMTEHSVARALVVDNDRNPIGIVTLRDLVLGEDPED